MLAVLAVLAVLALVAVLAVPAVLLVQTILWFWNLFWFCCSFLMSFCQRMSCVNIQLLKCSCFLLFLGYELNCIFEDMVRVLWHRLEDIISVVLFLHFYHYLFFEYRTRYDDNDARR